MAMRSDEAVDGVCPYCGQVLAGDAPAHLRRVEKEQEHALESAAAEKAAQLMVQQVADLNERHEAELAALRKTSDAERKRLERQQARIEKTERSKVEKEYADRSRQLDRIAADLQQKNQQLQRQVERLSAQESGKLNEETLFAQLVAEFPADAITRLGRGAPGADIIQEVRASSTDHSAAGVIAYECKDTATWNNSWIAKLKQDGAMHRALCLVLITRTFPRGKDSRLLVIDDVVVVEPTKAAVFVAALLRSHLLEMHRAELAATEQDTKTRALLRYVASPEFKAHLEEVLSMTDDLEALLRKEQLEHKRVWSHRETLYQAISGRVAEIEEELRTIVETSIEVPQAAERNKISA